jgi:hypothetical protein
MRGPEDAGNGRVDEAVTTVAPNRSRLPRQRTRWSTRHDSAQCIPPAGFNRQVGRLSSDEVGAEPDRERRQPALYLRRHPFAHTGIDEDVGSNGTEEIWEIDHSDGKRLMFSDDGGQHGHVVNAHRCDSLKDCLAIEDGIRECHAPAARRRLGAIVDDHGVTGQE